MGDVLPLCASPRSTGAVSYQKGKQSLKTVVSFFKTFRWAWPSSLGGPPDGDRPLVVGVDMLWWGFSTFPFFCMVAAFIKLIVVPHFDQKMVVPQFFVFLIVFTGFIFHVLMVYSVVYWHQNMPFQLMGAKAKFMIEVIPMITAAALRHLLGFKYEHVALLLGCTTYFYTYAHFLHVAYDIGVIDVLLGIAMQVLVYMWNVEFLVRALAFSFCFVLCFYRYMTYCAPEILAPCKKELERPPY